MKDRADGRADGGAALLICLLLLAALTMLGLAAASDTYLQRRMVENLDDSNLALRAADTALAWGEDWLRSLDATTRPAPCTPPCEANQVIRSAGSYPPDAQHLDGAWWQGNAFAAGHDPVTGALLDPGRADAGRWIVEEVHFAPGSGSDADPPDVAYYRVTARGSANPGANVVVTEGLLARPWRDAAWSDPLPRSQSQPDFCRRLQLEPPCGRQAWRRLR